MKVNQEIIPPKGKWGSLDPRPGEPGPPLKPWRLARYVEESSGRWIEMDFFDYSGVRVAEGRLGEHPDFRGE